MEIEAVQYIGFNAFKKIKEVFPDIELESHRDNVVVWDYLQITWVVVNNGDYIIKGMKGEYYPCAPDVFEAKYEAVE